METKSCTKCNLDKPLQEFGRDKSKKDGRNCWCFTCKQSYREQNREHGRAKNREWRDNNREHHRESARNWYHNNKSRRKNQQLQYEYGITLQEYHDMLTAQSSGCAICGRIPERRSLVVDHNHHKSKGEPSYVRELLCDTCNVAVGMLKDNPELALETYRYLKRHE